MKDSLLRKNWVIGIIVLFVGASIVPVISGDIGKIIVYHLKKKMMKLV